MTRPDIASTKSITRRLLDCQRQMIALSVGLLGLGMYLWQLRTPNYLQLYDSGVYYAATSEFVSGALPYRDFAFVQPPGILLLMSPVALFGRVFGAHDGFIMARIVSAIVTAANASLLAWLVRPRGRIAMLLSGAGLALVPVAVFFSSGLRLEPYCLLFVLLGSSVILSQEHQTGRLSTRSLAIGGLLFGVAGLVEFWAIFPFLALAVSLIPRYSRRVAIFVGAACSGFAALCLPFFLTAPRNFVSQIFVEQLSRRASSAGVLWRLIDMTGFSATSVVPTATEAAVAFVALAVLVSFAYVRRVEHETVDIYLLLAAVITVCGLLAAPRAYIDYSYFALPFLLGLLGVSVGRLGPLARSLSSKVRVSTGMRKFVARVTAASAVLLCFALVLYVTSFYSFYASHFGIAASSAAAVSEHVPAGSCVVYDEIGIGVVANRIQPRDDKCPKALDVVGMSKAWGSEVVPPPAKYVAEWKTYFETADYVVSVGPLISYTGPISSYRSSFPWSASLSTWFSSNYHLVYTQWYLWIYANDART